jgi:hypothetical protein
LDQIYLGHNTGTLIASNNLQLASFQTDIGSEMQVVKPKGQGTLLVANRESYRKLATLSQIENILREAHDYDGSHCGIGNTYARIKEEYCFLSRDIVIEYVNRCRACHDVRAVASKRAKPMQPIIAKGTFYHLVIDLIDFSHSRAGPDNKHSYIIHIIDHYSSFRIAEAAITKSASEVLFFLKRIFAIIGFPVILQSDNGGEFKNSLVEEFLLENDVEFRHGKPYTPQTQGKIERANYTLKSCIDKLIKVSKSKKTWFDVLQDAVFSINTNLSTSTKKAPYEVVFLQAPFRRGKLRITIPELDDQKIDDNDNVVSLINENNITMVIPANQARILEVPVSRNENRCDLNQNSNSNPIVLEDVAMRMHGEVDGNYNHSIQLMKTNHDKQFKILKYHIGDIVGVLLKDEYLKKNISKLFPAVVIGYEQIDDYNYYLLGYKFKVVKGKFKVSDLVPLPRETYALFVGVTDDLLSDTTIFGSWGRDENDPDEFMYITAPEAYENYISFDNPIEELPENAASNPIPPNNFNSILDLTKDDENIPFPSVFSQSLGERVCCICDQKINLIQKVITCGSCNREMHDAASCIYGIVQYQDAKSQILYCAISCFKDWPKFEVEITGETERFYKVKYNNGECGVKAKSIMNTLAEYYKIVTIYNLPKTTNRSTAVAQSSSPGISKRKRARPNIASSSQANTNFSSSKRCCFVCKESLTEFNWKKCHGCGNEIHGKIICKLGDGIIDDDGIVYCSKECHK